MTNKRWKYIRLSHWLNSARNYFLSTTCWHNFEEKRLVLFQRIPTCKQTFVELFVFRKFDILFQWKIWKNQAYETVISDVSNFVLSNLHNGYPDRLVCTKNIFIFFAQKNITTIKIDLQHSMFSWLCRNDFRDFTGDHFQKTKVTDLKASTKTRLILTLGWFLKSKLFWILFIILNHSFEFLNII